MDKIHIYGGTPLKGRIPISGAKNASLPLMAACLLTDAPLTLSNLPDLADITSMATLLEYLGVHFTYEGLSGHGQTITLTAKDIKNTVAPYDLVRKMRASIVVLGPLLARARQARVSLPGGCAIGTRPVDYHLRALSELGADVHLEGGYIHASAPHGLRGTTITFPTISVTGTENILMAACLAEGETKILNAAGEPEVKDLADCLESMGAKISGAGTNTIIIEGVESLTSTTHHIIPDRIEMGTYAIAAAMTGGDLELIGASLDLLPTVTSVLQKCGVSLTKTHEGLRVTRTDNTIQGLDIMTEPFPGFPTDLQAQIMALMSIAEGAAMITETLFENRFMHVPELQRMGANITVHGASALVRGVARLAGAPVMATDLRASISLVLAGLAAEGETVINRVYHLDRGYEQVENKLAACGAIIERIRGNQNGFSKNSNRVL